jgi:MFS family permease
MCGFGKEERMSKRDFYGWKLLFVFWIIVLINLAFPMYGSSVVNSVMMRDLNLDRRMLGFLFSLYTIMSGLPGPLVAVCVERFGIRITLASGCLLVAAGSVLMATVVSAGLHAALAFGVIIGIGVAMGGMITTQAGLARWFIRRRALALAIISTATGVGGFLAAPLLNIIISETNGNWRMGWWFIAASSCIAALIAIIFVKERPDDLNQAPDGGTIDDEKSAASKSRKWRGAVHITTENWSYREVVTGPIYWLMILSQMGVGCGYAVFLAHGVAHMQDLGHTRDAGSWAISMMALTGLGAKALVGALGDRIDPRYILSAFVATFGLGQLLALQADTNLLLILASSLLGIGFGGGVVCMAAVLSNYYGTKTFAALVGLTIAMNTTLGSIAPSVAGWLYDGGHGYQGIFYFLAAWCVLGAVVLFVIKPPVRKTRPDYAPI